MIHYILVTFYIQKTSFYHKNTCFKKIYKYTANCFCLKHFFYKRLFLYINVNRMRQITNILLFVMFYSYLRKKNDVLKRNVLNKKDEQCLYQSFIFKVLFDKTMFLLQKTPIKRNQSKKIVCLYLCYECL